MMSEGAGKRCVAPIGESLSQGYSFDVDDKSCSFSLRPEDAQRFERNERVLLAFEFLFSKAYKDKYGFLTSLQGSAQVFGKSRKGSKSTYEQAMSGGHCPVQAVDRDSAGGPRGQWRRCPRCPLLRFFYPEQYRLGGPVQAAECGLRQAGDRRAIAAGSKRYRAV